MKSKIINTSIALFTQYGHRSVGMDDVANKLGISKKTLYQHFSSKEELLVECVELLIGNFMMTARKIKAQNGHPILTLLRIYLSLLEELYVMNHVYIHSINKYHSNVQKVIDQFRNELIEKYANPLLLEAYDQNCLRKDLDIDAFISIRLKTIDQHYLDLLCNAPNSSLKECFYHLVAFQLSGICALSFQQKYNELLEEVLA